MVSAITVLDFSILYWIQDHLRTTFLDVFFPWITTLGNSGALWIVLGIALLLFRRTRVCGICVLACLAVNAIIGELFLKNLFGRVRPCQVAPIADMLIAAPGSYSFPSGHTASSFTAATAIFLSHRRAGVAAYILAALIAFSRVYCYVHFPTDILGGALLGMGVAYLFTSKIRRAAANFRNKKTR